MNAKLLLLAVVLWCMSLCAVAQTGYFSWTAGAGALLYPATNQQLQVTIPYTVTDAAGNTAQKTFTSNTINPYSRPVIMASPFTWEAGNEKRFLLFRLYAASAVTQVSLGYGQNYYFDFPGMPERSADRRTFVFKPSLNFNYNHYIDNDKGSRSYLGSINNDSNTLHILGMSSGPTYSTTDYNEDGSTTTYTTPTKTLDLFYVQDELAIVPKIGISNNQYKHWLHWEVSAAYYVPVYEVAGIKMYQNEVNALNSKPVALDANNAVTTFAGKKISSAPYRFSGFFVSATLGFTYSAKSRHTI